MTDSDAAHRITCALEPNPEGPDLRILEILQREGRLLDFLLEDINGYDDGQIGAAVRDIHRGARKGLEDSLVLSPVLDQSEGDRIEVPVGFDPRSIRLLGNLRGSPPYQGTLKHQGWKVTESKIAGHSVSNLSQILAPAEVEIE